MRLSYFQKTKRCVASLNRFDKEKLSSEEWLRKLVRCCVNWFCGIDSNFGSWVCCKLLFFFLEKKKRKSYRVNIHIGSRGVVLSSVDDDDSDVWDVHFFSVSMFAARGWISLLKIIFTNLKYECDSLGWMFIWTATYRLT